MTARIHGVTTAVPEHWAPQKRSFQFMRRVIEATTDGVDREQALMYLEAIHEGCGIDQRYSVIDDFTHLHPDRFEFFGPNWRLDPFPSTRQRMAIYQTKAVQLARRVGEDALAQANVDPDEITHINFVTCTGLFAPGPDVLLVNELGLRNTVRRTVIGFMGCYGAFNGLRNAAQIVAGNPDAVVLQICVELCTLHYQRGTDPETLVSNSLFGDGAAALVVAHQDRLPGGVCDLMATHSYVAGDSLDQMRWDIGDTGFEMGLDRRVPDTIKAGAAGFVDGLLSYTEMGRDHIDHWLIHPGGPRILDAVRDGIDLMESDVAVSRSVLRDYGNMSSPSVLFVLKRQLDATKEGDSMAMLGFGPGLTMEGALLQR